MKRKVEDFLSGESPQEDLDNQPPGDNRKLGERILSILRLVKAKELSPNERTELWGRIEATMERKEKRPKHVRMLQYVAVACMFIAVAFLFLRKPTAPTSYDSLLLNAINNQELIEQQENVSVSRGDGQHIHLSDNEEVIDLSADGNGFGSDGKEEHAYSTLTVPYGKRIEVILPDNSKVWLNAGSQLTFPSDFDATERRVYLEGEGYFDVERDRHRPFFVHTENMAIKVRGTAFNVRSYKDDSEASAVLVNGEIELEGAGKTVFDRQILKPGTAAVLRKESKRLSISKEAVEDYVSWKDKQLILKNTPLTEILKRLERVYNTTITVTTPSGADETFSGRLDLNQSLTDLLTTLYNPVEYQLEKQERRISIRKKK